MTETRAPATTGPERSFLERTAPWWHLGYGVVVLAVATLWLLTPAATPAERVAGLTLLGVIVLAYLLVGRHLLDRTPSWRTATWRWCARPPWRW
ncbi:MAG: hypothetical protein ACRDT4_20360 [Micromonosporaceae bacterium]